MTGEDSVWWIYSFRVQPQAEADWSPEVFALFRWLQRSRPSQVFSEPSFQDFRDKLDWEGFELVEITRIPYQNYVPEMIP